MIHLTPIKSIRKYCVECSGDNRKEVRLCPIASCPLFPYRMGVRPSTLSKMGLRKLGR